MPFSQYTLALRLELAYSNSMSRSARTRSERVRALRHALKLSQSALATRTGGLDQSEVNKIEVGRNQASTHRVLAALARGFGLPLDDLVAYLDGALDLKTMVSRCQLGVALLAIGIFASIYHPVGTAMIVSYADKLGREMGINGVWGNLGVASSALVTGVVGQYLGWRYAFFIPGALTVLLGLAFAATVVHEDRKGTRQAAAQARIAREDLWRLIVALLMVVIAISTTFNAVTVALPKLFAERLADLTRSPALLGVIAAGVYVFGAMTQYTIGKLLDRHSLKTVALPLSFMLAPFLYLAASLSNLPLILVSIGIIMGAFGQVTVNDALVGKYTPEEWRSRAYAVRYFVGFTAAGASVGLVAWLYERGGFVTMLQAFAGLCLFVIAAAIILPREIAPKPAG